MNIIVKSFLFTIWDIIKYIALVAVALAAVSLFVQFYKYTLPISLVIISAVAFIFSWKSTIVKLRNKTMAEDNAKRRSDD